MNSALFLIPLAGVILIAIVLATMLAPEKLKGNTVQRSTKQPRHRRTSKYAPCQMLPGEIGYENGRDAWDEC